MPSELVEVEGHIIDSLILAKVLDVIVDAGADYRMVEVEIGRTSVDASRARLEVVAGDDEALSRLVDTLLLHGANRVEQADATVATATTDGVLPEGFYATTNLPTRVRLSGRWVDVENPEMDCGLVVLPDGRLRTVPMHRVRAGDQVVLGTDGVRAQPLDRPRGASPFEFMTSDVSSEKPKDVLVGRVADRLRQARASGGRILAVCGPAVVHTGAAPSLARLVRDGWVDVLFAGNGFAAHDIESAVRGTSLGVPLSGETPAEGAHSNHLRVINEVRRRGSIAAAVADGWLTGGVMYECVLRDVPFVLGGSVRDDGPLPDVVTDVVEAADAMRDHITGVSVALMLASTLHAIATGNILPAGVETYCVDINQAVVTKLADRGSHQALGVVTDVGLFLDTLASHLTG
ncbi:MAG TPA: TIGR00300 family protein [Acidimicrobiales bacterium]|jgi:lysine-ketoglutarate reductase/saccharopine dehydrogenase-like protein (TIGR00300 family)|nr:TIGR00300 family protein [Acidimicrobiales bacterium]